MRCNTSFLSDVIPIAESLKFALKVSWKIGKSLEKQLINSMNTDLSGGFLLFNKSWIRSLKLTREKTLTRSSGKTFSSTIMVVVQVFHHLLTVGLSI